MPSTCLKDAYPWAESPLIVSAPMLRIAMPKLAVAVSEAGGLGFLAAGFDVTDLAENLQTASELILSSPNRHLSHFAGRSKTLPLGVGFLNWGANLDLALAAMARHPPCAVWFFAPREAQDLVRWAKAIRTVTERKTLIWVQVGTVAEAVQVASDVRPDVLVVQGADAGGHGLKQSASILTLLPEVSDALATKASTNTIPLIAAGGIVDGRGLAASLCLGAGGAVMGTRFLAASEASISRGYQQEVLRASDGGISTVRTTVYDACRRITGWPPAYNGRGVINQSYRDSQNGLPDEENQALYDEAIKLGDNGWGLNGRMTTYAGTGVGLVQHVLPARSIVESVRNGARGLLGNTSH